MAPPSYTGASDGGESEGIDDLEASASGGSLGGALLDDDVSRPGRPFPSDEYISLLDGLNQVALSNYAPPRRVGARLRASRPP